MPIPWALLKGLSYPATAIASAGSGALAMYFAKPDVDLEPENKQWNEDMQKLRSEIDESQQKAKKIAEEGKTKLTGKQKSVNAIINEKLTSYGTEVKTYVDCLDKLFDEISHVAKNSWLSRLYYTKKEIVDRCRERPKHTKYSG